MRAVLLGVVLVLSVQTPVRADAGLTDAVAAAYFPRTVDAGLHTIAHQRVVEIAACACLDHGGMRAGTAEVLAFNTGLASPVSSAVASRTRSPVHHAILSDRTLGRIGCAEAVVAGVHWFACVLASGPLPVAPAPAPAAGSVGSAAVPVGLLPDTALLPRAVDGHSPALGYVAR